MAAIDAVSEIDVVVLAWNDGPLLQRAVDSALESVGVEVHVIVVDNGSDPPAEVPSCPNVTLLRSETNLGVARGRNLGVRAGASPVVCFLDSDATLRSRTLEGLIEALSEAGVGLVGPVFSGQAPEESGGAAPSLSRKVARVIGRTSTYGVMRRRDAPRWDVDFVIGACQVFRREVYDAVGGVDERWFYGPEDADFCMRIRLAGWRVVQCGDVVCEHPPRRRNRRIFTRRGLSHAKAVTEFLWRHRRFQRSHG